MRIQTTEVDIGLDEEKIKHTEGLRSAGFNMPPCEHERTAATGVSVVIPRDDVAHERETARRARANAKNALEQSVMHNDGAILTNPSSSSRFRQVS